MSWYKTGTITATNSSKIITGTGTKFTNLLNGVSAGRMLLLPATGTVQIYEIESVQSDTQLTLVSAFTGTTGTGKSYAIPTSPAVSIEQFAHEVTATLAYYQQQLSGWQQILTGTGNVTLTTPDGQTVTVRSQQAWDTALNGKANSSDVFLLKGSLGTNDLNNVVGTDYQGIWTQGATANATLARNYPVVSAGSLEVTYNSASGVGMVQRYTTHASNRVFIRFKARAKDAWSAWVEHWTSANLNPVKNAPKQIRLEGEAALHTWALDAANTSGTFRNDAITTATSRFGSGWFSKVSGTYSIFTVGPSPATSVVRLQAGDAQGYVNHIFWTDKNLTNPATLDTPQTVTAIKTHAAAVVTTNAVAFRGTLTNGQVRNLAHINSENIVHLGDAAAPTTIHGNATPLIQVGSGASYPILASGLNAVADSNGFWKTASPVVKLFADGTSELTSEAEGITTERLSEGVYRISGCLGLNADRAWSGDEGGIDVPMCRNKLPRLWVDYGGDEGSSQINPDGSIVIRTYHRPHPDAPAFARNEIEGYANGDPIDIPRDTFISVRVQMLGCVP